MKQKLLSILALLLMTATGAWAQASMLETPLTLEAKTGGTIVVSKPQSGMQYSKNYEAKTELTADAGYNSGDEKWTITVAEGDKVQFFGNGTSIADYSGTNIWDGTADCYIYGNIMSLVDETGFATATTLTGGKGAGAGFGSLFSDNSHLYNHDTYKLVLPATTLAEGCYARMFYNCTNLTTAPELPATTLVTGCYYNMFNGCSNLNSLTCLATDISAEAATYGWLDGVPATGTFTKAAGMEDWTSGGNGIPAGWTVVDNVVLTDMKKTPLTLEAKTAGTIMVFGPQSGMQYSKNYGAKTELTADAGYNSGNEVWTITVTAGETVQFYGNGTSITSYGSNNVRIAYGTADVYIYGNIMSLVDEENFATATTLTDVNAFSYLFSYNSQLYNHDTYELVLPATTLAARCYQAMFSDCTNLTTAPALPATTLEEGCYSGMFTYCTNLTTAPVLPATTLADYCYYNMFNGCTKLNSVTCLATDISASDATTDWLSGVAATGTFTKAAGMTGWPTNSASGIPSGWTVVDNVVLTDGSDPSALKAYADQLCAVTYKRSFTADKPSTVCLPFEYAPKTGETFYTFSGITKEGGNYVATMTEHTGATLEANTPYLYKSATTGDTDFSGTYTIPATISAGETTSGDWKFVGTYDTQEWTTAPTGIYGFSAQTVDGISQGEFVKVGAYVKVKPMRAYLKYKDGGENYAGAPMMAPRRAAETLPERISVRLIDAEGNVTGIGTLETRTGEVRFDPEAWYTLNGTRLSGQPTRKGIYVNNGKKVIIK